MSNEISVEINGIFCPKCNTLHPTLFWHEKYDDYIAETKYIEKLINAHERFELTIGKDDAQRNFLGYLETLEIKKTKSTNKCVNCSAKTSFKNKKTNNYVCSDECKYADNQKNEFLFQLNMNYH